MNQRINLEATHPGEHIRQELEARGWTQLDLATILGRTPASVNGIIKGVRGVTPTWAKALGEAFSVPPEFFLNLQVSYELSKVKLKKPSTKQWAKLFNKAPIREMQKRSWVKQTRNIDIMTAQITQIYGVNSIDEELNLRLAARRSTDYNELSISQLAWYARVKNLARAVNVSSRYASGAFNSLKTELAKYKSEVEEIRHIPKLLSEYGIKFLIVEHLPHTKIDGVCIWLDERSPVIALSMRYDRINWFWFTLAHELAHVYFRDGMDGSSVDISLVGVDAQTKNEKPNEEKRADKFAEDLLIDQNELEDFIQRVNPLYSIQQIAGFAKRIGVHPGIVIGQLQHRDIVPYTHYHEYTVKVRDIITKTALTDGWGNYIEI